MADTDGAGWRPGLRLIAAVFVFAGCGPRESAPRTYVEQTPVQAPPPASAPMPVEDAAAPPPMPAPTPAAPLTWTAPEGWSEQPGNGIRRATFVVPAADGTPAGECAITVLAGKAGGLGANVMRWAGQIGLNVPPEQMRAFIDALPRLETAGGHALYVADFTRLADSGAAADAPSMLAAMIERPADCVFVKLIAVPARLAAERARFEALSRSVR